MQHPVVPVIAGDKYSHDFNFGAPIGSSWSATILNAHFVPIVGLTISAAALDTTAGLVRVEIAAAETLELLGIGYMPTIRLRDDTLQVTRMEWKIDVTP